MFEIMKPGSRLNVNAESLKHFVLQVAVGVGKDLIMPKVLQTSLLVVEKAYENFIVLDEPDQNALCQTANRISDEQCEAVVIELKQRLDCNGQLSEKTLHALLKRCVESLRDVRQESETTRSEQFRRSLNSLNKTQIPPIDMQPLEREPPEISGYKLLQRLGHGATADVYLARHLDSGQPRAVKVINDVDLGRFEREIRFMKGLRHPNLIEYAGRGELPGHRAWIAMEFVGSRTLAQRMAAERIDPLSVICIVREMLSGLAALHERGVIHRDFKPENILLTHNDRVRLIDFGLVKLAISSQGQRISNVLSC